MVNFVQTFKNELKFNQCGFNHEPLDTIVRSEWQSKSKNYIYLIYRCAVGVFVIVVVAITLVGHLNANRAFGLYFIYLTNWGLLLNMIVGVLGAVLVTIWHFWPMYHGN